MIRVAGPADAAEVGRIFAAGFSDDPVMTWVFAEPDRQDKLDAFFGFVAGEALVPLGATYLGGEACASWTPPDPAPWPDDRAARFVETISASCTGEDLARLWALEDAMRAAHPSERHWYLGVIATAPAARSRGLGSALLAHTLAPVDEAGLPAYLEATCERNAALYERFGFVRTGSVTVAEGPSLIAMWREPRGRTTPSPAAG